MCLGDRALREVAREKTVAAIWTKLEKLYMTKSLANRLYLKLRHYSFKMNEEKPLSDQIDDFNKIIDDLENIDIKMEDEDQMLILLNAMPKTYEHFRDAMLYGREQTITFEEVQSTIRAKELQRRIEVKEETNGEGLLIKGKKNFKPGKGNKALQRNKNEVAETRMWLLRMVSNSSASIVIRKDISRRIALRGRKSFKKRPKVSVIHLLQLKDM